MNFLRDNLSAAVRCPVVFFFDLVASEMLHVLSLRYATSIAMTWRNPSIAALPCLIAMISYLSKTSSTIYAINLLASLQARLAK